MSTYRIHAILVHFPVSAWAAAALLQLTMPLHGGGEIRGVDIAAAIPLLTWVGLVAAGCAAVAGLIELSALPPAEPGTSTANRHLLSMGAASGLFLLLALAHSRTGILPDSTLLRHGLAAAALICLATGGHFGSRLARIRHRFVEFSVRPLSGQRIFVASGIPRVFPSEEDSMDGQWTSEKPRYR